MTFSYLGGVGISISLIYGHICAKGLLDVGITPATEGGRRKDSWNPAFHRGGAYKKKMKCPNVYHGHKKE